ncbi:MAG: hypothetical protein IPO29_01540 [Anaerolineae bacterium]|nr:hypothetical protein [Anaerolineae bacterium]
MVPYLDGRDSAGNGGGITTTNDVISGIVYTTDAVFEGYVFAELSRSSLRGFVWVDANANDLYDYSEAYVNGVTLTLTGTDDLGASVSIVTQTLPTCPFSYCDSQYRFIGLRPGNYTITEQQPAGYASGLSVVGQAGGTAGDNVISAIPLSRTGAYYNYLFSEYPAGLNGSVFLDADNDGFRDPGEGGFNMPYAFYRAQIRLTGVTTANVSVGPIDKDVDTSGLYSFTGLASGIYTLTQIKLPYD